MLHGKTPWTGKNPYGLLQNIKNKPLELKQDLSDITKDFLQRTLGVRESDRPSWDQLFRHKIFGGFFEHKFQENKKL